MPYILFMMFLITAPGQSIPKAKRLYTLQSTHSMEFDSPEACTIARDSIVDSVAITDTILVVSSCIPKGVVKAETKSDTDKKIQEFTDKKFGPRPSASDARGIIQFNTLPH